MTTLNQEFKRFTYIDKIKNLKHANMYEYLNSLDSLFIDMANLISEGNSKGKPNSGDKIFINLDKTHPIWTHFSKRMKDNKLQDRSVKIREIINQFLDDDQTYNVRFTKRGNTFMCGRFKFELPSFRIEALEKRGSLEEIITMILRYQCMVARGNHWNIPLKFYKYLYENEGVRIEGFSSPLNSQLMLLGDDVQFCSLFPDTDKVFGSIGSFFDLDEPEAISVSPPYTEKLINECIIKSLEWKNTRLYYNVPMWTDMPGYDMLDKTAAKKNVYYAGQFYYENNGEKMMFKRGKHLMYTLRAKNAGAVFATLNPSEEMSKEFKANGRLVNKHYSIQ